MKKINLLVITRDLSNNVEQWSVELIKKLNTLLNLTIWYKPGNIEEIIRKDSFTPDFILLNDMRTEFYPEIKGLDILKIPFGILLYDAHFYEEGRKNFIISNKVESIFLFTKTEFLNGTN